LTLRQRRVLSLVARGLTSKEIAHVLGITERGVAAHISRMLTRSGAHNRAELLAQTLSADLGKAVTFDSPLDTILDSEGLPGLQQELESYEDAPFFVGVTIGPDQVLVYQNRLSRDLTGAPEIGRPHREVFTGDANQDWWREKGSEALVTGRPVVVSSVPSRWQRPDGTWVNGVFSCVAQPLRDELARVRGVLWICARGG
jgi:DNA-binding CsgD family transcriptional regulator